MKRKTPSFREVFEKLPLFDDLHLRMQATNLDMVDAIIANEETALLREYIQIERTPVQQFMVTSALSQLWILGMYELVRTWRERIKKVEETVRALRNTPESQREEWLAAKKEKVLKLGAHRLGSAWEPFEKAIKDSRYLAKLQRAYDRSELAFRRIEALRMTLAKHEVPKPKGLSAIPKLQGLSAMFPGYGRIDESNGSIFWQIVLNEQEVDLVSRRTVAEACRTFGSTSTKVLISRAVQAKLETFPRQSYATTRVELLLRDGTRIPGVTVAWNKQVVHVEGVRFDARDAVDAFPS